jgi:cell wall-associated NlpC family hydrolase
MFEKNKWIHSKDIKKNNFKEKNFIKILNLFVNCKYKWGGKTFDGIDCSALVQMYYLYNNKYFPRDAKDQIKIKKGPKNSNNLKKGNIIYWKGHVAVCINSKKLIHAYGPRKKVLIMNIKNTIKIIEKTANLKVKKITKI